MKTLLLNGSPKGNASNSGSYFLAKAFAGGMRKPCEIRAIAKEDRRELLNDIRRFDRIIVIAPNYIHSIPGDTLDFLYALPQAAGNQCLGFIIQSGYPEAEESEVVCRFLNRLTSRLGYTYLGTVVKGECAGIAIMPQMFQKLEKQFAEFGALYEQTGRFDERYMKAFAKPYRLSKFQVWLLNITCPIGNHFGWHKMMKANHAYDKRLDTPYLDKSH